MGLSAVHGIVNNLGGAVTVSSKANKGARFDVYLPVIEKPFGQKNEAENHDVKKGCGHILLVDDEEGIISVVEKMLTKLGYQVTSCTDSLEALKDFESRPDDFDLIITDMAMPKMTGEQLCRKVMHIRPEIPILVCTGFNVSLSSQEAEAIGIRNIISKPVGIRQLSDIVSRTMSK